MQPITLPSNDPDDAALYHLAEQAGLRLKAQGHSLTLAESCTGGWLAKCVTDVAGSSGWFERGFVTYGNDAKNALLGVTTATLEAHGAVSGETVGEMAAGALQRGHAQVAVAVSGIAGPGGATPGKPVGTVWFAWQQRGKPSLCRRACFSGDRDAVRRQAVAAALQGLIALYDADGGH
ncbi:MAG: nicotinamide-nucleotide amidase [Methylococcaceae bacterium]|nr:MAG: nicotinamide-nucleotide amidase [Methylococcaceae bacterium]